MRLAREVTCNAMGADEGHWLVRERKNEKADASHHDCRAAVLHDCSRRPIGRHELDTGKCLKTCGKNPNGFIIYGKDGRMLVLIVRRDRPKPESVDKITDQQRADLHRSMTAYGGTYKFDGKRVEHNIDISWNEVFTGTTLVREITKDGDRLMYTSPPARLSGDGRMSQNTLVWEKVK